MFSEIEKKLFRSLEFKTTGRLLREKKSVSIAGLAGSALGFLVKYLFKQKFSKLVVVTPDMERTDQILNDLYNLLNNETIFCFPAKTTEHDYTNQINIEKTGFHLKALDRLAEQQTGIFVLPVTALSESVPDLKIILENRLQMIPGQEIQIEQISEILVEFGYQRVDLVSAVGEFSVRGGLIDVFPFELLNPIRVEFFGDFIETIRTFDVVSQRSQNQHNKVMILSPTVNRSVDFNINTKTLIDMFSSETLFLLDEPELFERSFSAQKRQLKSKIEIAENNTGLENNGLTDWSQIQKKLEAFHAIAHYRLGKPQHVDVLFETTSNVDFRGNIKLLRQKIKQFSEKNILKNPATYILLEEKYEIDRLLDLLEDQDDNNYIKVGQSILHTGFVFKSAGIMIVTEKDLYGRIPRKRNLGKFRGGIPISKLNALSHGEIMVHIDHGIGRYLGLEKIVVAGSEQECIKLQYRGGDLLFVNIDHMGRVNRHKGAEGAIAQLNRLGGKDWDRLKDKMKKAIEKMAKDLLELYAHRKAKKGFAFSRDHLWQNELEASFLYDETIDQLRTIDEVKKDMESEIIMDRLVCGDVGFGKTEVAVRAAFKAVMDGKQVALLVPTTVLAQQHYDTFSERLSAYPVEVALLSRFRTKKQQAVIVKDLKLGKIDIVIGTHRLLSKDIQFKELGLLIVDEEHRFGVGQKEKIKALFKLVDVLSLTATPIPRTLHLAMMGSRDMSSINTPPKDRLPVIAEVVPFDKNLIRRAITEEVSRGGQVFIVHNRVRSIESMATMINRLVPGLRIAVAHGQMLGHELESVMLDFVRKKFDCLVSTMIIESGLDMPNVNTLIVNRADKLGLAQLYQLKGRVGRSNRQAYAYFLAPAFKFLSKNALKRLQTIEENLELGSGLQIAMKDLEIRGAGNLLGKQQSGFINAVGFDLYCKLLNEAVLKIKGLEQENKNIQPRIDVFIESEYDAYIPEDFVSMDYERVQIYQRLALVSSEVEISELEEELRDRFGALPKPARVLLELTRLKILAACLGIDKLRIKKGELTAYFSDMYYGDKNQETLQKLVRSIQESAPELLRFIHGKKFGFKFRLKQTDESSLIFTKEFFYNLIKRAA